MRKNKRTVRGLQQNCVPFSGKHQREIITFQVLMSTWADDDKYLIQGTPTGLVDALIQNCANANKV